MVGNFQQVTVFARTIQGQKKHDISLVYSRTRTLQCNPERLRWVDGYTFNEYFTKFGRDTILDKIHGPPRLQKVPCLSP